MQNKWLGSILVSSLLLGATGCPDIKVDPGEGVNDMPAAGPIIEFDPSNKIIPFPNNLLLNPMTGKVNLPMSCGEGPASKATREGVLNKLDGFGTFETAMTITLTEPVDPTTLAGHVLLYKRASGATAVDPTSAMAIPVVTIASMTTRFDASCMNPVMVPQVIIIPRVPLEQKSTYVVALTAGIKTAMGADYGPSFTWALVRQEAPLVELDASGNVIANNTPLDPRDPGDLASLQGIDLLWKAHAKAMQFLRGANVATSDVLLAWEFNTQTTTDPLDPTVAGSPAANVLKSPLLNMQSLTAGIPRTAAPYVLCPAIESNTQCYLKIALGFAAGASGAAIYTTGNAICGQVGCANVGDVVGGALMSKQYQIDTPNMFDPAKPIPGPWSDPVSPTVSKTATISVLGFLPAVAPPPSGYPTIIFGHGLGQSKTNLFAIGPQLATPRAALGFATGFASFSIDFVNHDTRATRISNDAAIGCADVAGAPPSPVSAPQCYAPLFSTNLATTRDSFRQSVLDLEGLVEGLKACGTTMCATNVPTLQVDAAHLSYLGQSLGGIFGSMLVAAMPDIKGAVLNVAGVGWVDIIENTKTLAFTCPLVDSLIAAGILVGDKFATNPATALCLGDTWKAQPGWRQFAVIGRWALDPTDPANFTRKLAGRRFLLQEVVGDQVVPNVATDNEGALTGLMAAAATCAPPPPVPPSAALLSMPMTNKFLKYMDLTPGTCDATGTAQAFPGNAFEHGSLLRPAAGRCTTNTMQRCSVDAQCTTAGDTCNQLTVQAGQLGTQRLQTDAITYLVINR
jgi:hypothetical protein